MDFMLEPKRPSDPILRTALIVGAVSFVLGYIGPLLISDSNLGPLLGIFLTGPLGLLAGALIGIIMSARQSPPPLKRELRYLAGAWIAALFFTVALDIGNITPFAIGAQLAVFVCAATLFSGYSAKLPGWVRHWKLLLLIGGALTILSSIYPPLNPASVGEARYAFFLDPRFDARTNVPEYSIHPSMLLMQWLIIAAVVAFPILVDRISNRGDRT